MKSTVVKPAPEQRIPATAGEVSIVLSYDEAVWLKRYLLHSASGIDPCTGHQSAGTFVPKGCAYDMELVAPLVSALAQVDLPNYRG